MSTQRMNQMVGIVLGFFGIEICSKIFVRFFTKPSNIFCSKTLASLTNMLNLWIISESNIGIN